MKLVYTSEDIVYLYHLKNILESAGIESIIKNDGLSSLAGEVPLTICWPELWVKDNLKIAYAKELIENAKTVSSEIESDWKCENCGEKHSAQFTDCWNCQNIKAF